MNKLLTHLFLAICSFLLSSCIVVGYNSGLNQLTTAQKEKVIRTDKPIQVLPCDSNVYIVSETQIQDYIQRQDSCIVFHWYAACPYTFRPKGFEQYCDSLNYVPIIVMSCFSWHSFNWFDATHTPLLFPDIEPYKTDRVYKYMEMLCQNLTGVAEEPATFWLFKHGKFERFLRRYSDETGVRLITLEEFERMDAMQREAAESAKQKKSG